MAQEEKFVRGPGLLNSTMTVAGLMIGSGILADGSFSEAAGKLNRNVMPAAWGLLIQGLFSAFYVLPRMIRTAIGGLVSYGNLSVHRGGEETSLPSKPSETESAGRPTRNQADSPHRCHFTQLPLKQITNH